MGSSPILVGLLTGNRSIGRLSALGVGGCEFKSHFLDDDVRISSLISRDGSIKYIGYRRGTRNKIKENCFGVILVSVNGNNYFMGFF